MGIMSKLKKLQKERLIVARLGFPDKAMEIDEHIEKIRADLRVSFTPTSVGLLDKSVVRRTKLFQNRCSRVLAM